MNGAHRGDEVYKRTGRTRKEGETTTKAGKGMGSGAVKHGESTRHR